MNKKTKKNKITKKTQVFIRAGFMGQAEGITIGNSTNKTIQVTIER